MIDINSFKSPEKFIDDCEYFYSLACENNLGEVKHDPLNYKIKQFNEYGKAFKTKVATLLLYPECPEHFECIKKIISLGASTGLKYAMIIHQYDKVDNELSEDIENDMFSDIVSYDGIYKKPHVHVVIKFKSQRYNTGVAKYLGVSSNYVKMYLDSLFGERIGYLIHCDNQDKYQYPLCHVCGTLTSSIEDILHNYMLSPFDMFLSMCDNIRRIDKDKIISRAHLQDLIISCGFSGLLRSSFYRLLCERVNDHNSFAETKYLTDKHNNVN